MRILNIIPISNATCMRTGDCHDDDVIFTKDLRSSRFHGYDELDDVQTMAMPTNTEGAIPRLWEVSNGYSRIAHFYYCNYNTHIITSTNTNSQHNFRCVSP